ncbi:hypothetical protein BDZ89DRAFT_597556 [Hymenopellis radicata]|nr:hypothetical protein BDZ89DRAFT_597556 [Hymenopellis radicata]
MTLLGHRVRHRRKAGAQLHFFLGIILPLEVRPHILSDPQQAATAKSTEARAFVPSPTRASPSNRIRQLSLLLRCPPGCLWPPFEARPHPADILASRNRRVLPRNLRGIPFPGTNCQTGRRYHRLKYTLHERN